MNNIELELFEEHKPHKNQLDLHYYFLIILYRPLKNTKNSTSFIFPNILNITRFLVRNLKHFNNL